MKTTIFAVCAAMAAVTVFGAATSPAATPEARVVTASGQLAVLNGLGTLDLHALAPSPFLIPAPSGTMTLVLHSTFEQPPAAEHVFNVMLWCTAVQHGSFYASGTDQNGASFYVMLASGGPLGLWLFGWGTSPSDGPCGAGPWANVPLIGAAASAP